MVSTKPSEPDGGRLLSVRIAEIRALTRNVRQFVLDSAVALPEAKAGAHLDVHLPEGGIRQYSLITPLCGPHRYVIAVKRQDAGRGGSLWLHERACIGMPLQAGAPRNHFELDEAAGAFLLIAGGIGITPIYAMFRRLGGLDRAVRLHYWCGAPEDALFLDELRAIPEAVLHYPSDGRVSAGSVVAAAVEGTQIYCCGPERMLRDCEASLKPGCRLRMERFAPAAASPAAKPGFVLRLARTGRDVAIPEGETILATLLAEGIDVAYSCEEGMCGACEARVLEGEVVHLDAVRSAADHDRLRTIMICCSRAKNDLLTLDL